MIFTLSEIENKVKNTQKMLQKVKYRNTRSHKAKRRQTRSQKVKHGQKSTQKGDTKPQKSINMTRGILDNKTTMNKHLNLHALLEFSRIFFTFIPFF